MLRLVAGDAEAWLSPEQGGALLGLRFAGQEMVRPAPLDAADPLAMASFPLVPYANRIAQGRFTFGGRDYRLPRNFGDHPHSLHGLGWTAPWSVEAAIANAATLVHTHPGGTGWPWPYRATQQVSLSMRMLETRLSVRNDADVAAPIGLGFHPYFPVDQETRLQFGATGLWRSTPPDHLPEALEQADALGDWAAGAAVSGVGLIDHYYEGWAGAAVLEWGNGYRMTLTASGARGLHVYRPPGAGFVCLEPVSHMPDAINRPVGMDSIAPGHSCSLTMRIALDEAAP